MDFTQSIREWVSIDNKIRFNTNNKHIYINIVEDEEAIAYLNCIDRVANNQEQFFSFRGEIK